jgi:RNA polymerase sigma factor (sigma-70 family)
MERTIQALAPRLLCYCRAKTNDATVAEEVAQESLAALVRSWQKRGPPRSPEAFVFATARRRAARAMLRRRLWLPLDALLGRRSNGLDPEASAIGRNNLKRTLSAISRLAHREREALLLVAIAEMSSDEAAQVLGISPSALKMRVLRARRSLVSLLENEDENRS